jgi:hypothetical protein
LAAASTLPHVGLVEALELCLLLCDREPEKFSRAAVRWHGHYRKEPMPVSMKLRLCLQLSALSEGHGRRQQQPAYPT